MQNLPNELQHLKNLIDDAESDTSIKVLRRIVKSAADKAPAADILKLAKTVLDCGINLERPKWAERN